MSVLANLEPKEVFAYFEDICAIPHASYQEGRLSDYCASFAKKHGLACFQDELKNIIIIKEASPGYEDAKPIILQGHLDMVCEKEPDSSINFDTDGLELKIDGDYIMANGTTLGGDDGIAVAYALAILASDSILHPKLEVVFTVAEEVGMEGASGIDVSMLEGRQMLNLDSEVEGVMLAGCAGGACVSCSLPVQRVAAFGAMLKISITGLAGGHSGAEINKGRANANTLMGRVLIELSKQITYNLAEWNGGKKDNAIPRSCAACICLAEESLAVAEQIVSKAQQDISNEYALTDPGIRLATERMPQLPSEMLDQASTGRAVMLVNMLPNGIQAMSADVPGLVETSLNLGILNLEKTEFVLNYAVRSSIGSAKDALIHKLSYLTQSIGGEARVSGDYPAWEFKRNSPLRDKLCSVYEKMYGKKPVIEAIHAGVECGLLSAKLPGLDCISIGPDMKAIHTTEEKLSISSVRRVWEYLQEVLKIK